MNKNLKFLGLLAILPLLTVALTTDYISEADAATKSAGTGAKKYGSATAGIVCGDRLCSETGGQTVLPKEPERAEEPEEAMEEAGCHRKRHAAGGDQLYGGRARGRAALQ